MVTGSRERPESEFDAGRRVRRLRAVRRRGRGQLPAGAAGPAQAAAGLAVEAGCLFSIDSDAHAPGQLDWLPYGCERAGPAECRPTGGQHQDRGRLLAWTAKRRPGRDAGPARPPLADSRHSFSYGAAYDPANTHFGLLLACNEDRLAAGTGFDDAPAPGHRGAHLGGLRRAGHADDAGHHGWARPGVVQRMSAGGGVRHSEYAVGGPVHYVQMWVLPATPASPRLPHGAGRAGAGRGPGRCGSRRDATAARGRRPGSPPRRCRASRTCTCSRRRYGQVGDGRAGPADAPRPTGQRAAVPV